MLTYCSVDQSGSSPSITASVNRNTMQQWDKRALLNWKNSYSAADVAKTAAAVLVTAHRPVISKTVRVSEG